VLDLVGANLKSLTDGTPSGEIITNADCNQVAKALLAVEMRRPPTQCGFKPSWPRIRRRCARPEASPKYFPDWFRRRHAEMDRYPQRHHARFHQARLERRD
jgi:hypothetical protein